MKLNQRYVKVFALYFVSIVTANIIVKNNNLIKTLIQTIDTNHSRVHGLCSWFEVFN